MTQEQKHNDDRGMSGGFVWFLMAAFVLALMVQNFIDTKYANVSFSYQLEHLVNLELIQPEKSRKTALNDNLATFSGQFRDRLTEDGKNRYKFLQLLDENHQLQNEKEEVLGNITDEKEKIRSAAEWFLQISGLPIPKSGYVVVDDVSSAFDTDQSVIVTSVPQKQIKSLSTLEREFAALRNNPTANGVEQFGSSLNEMIRYFRSPNLGIGSESLKKTLRELDRELSRANSGSVNQQMQIATFDRTLNQLSSIVKELDHPQNHMRLSKLRSVRNFRESLDAYQRLQFNIEENEAQLDKARQKVAGVIWFYNNNELSTKALERQNPEQLHQWFVNAEKEWNSFDQNRGGIFKAPDQPSNLVLEKTFKSQEPAPNYLSYIFTMMPILLVVLVLYLLFSRQMKGVGSNAMNFGKSPAKLMTKDNNKVTFKDVAGVEEAIEELEEIVEFLKNPHKFTALGGHIPKGVLCIGPPGTGKTLIAKAVAGEADRPFFSISGSDFVEMFVGVGASRIRDMFEQAKKNAPCIVFIDEIDAVGRHRGAGIGGGHDEREQTLNQLLVEMDGFATNEGVILMAATNRPDVLDKALLRPGRFDRQVMISLPDIKGRYEILKVHARKIKMDPTVDLNAIARSTPGASGADLANLLNEAALIAARKNRTAVTAQDTAEARDKVLYGKERRSLELDENEKLTTAYHESGHVMVGLSVEHSDPVDKVTIIPRGFSLGATMFLPEKNRLSYWKKEIIDQLAVLMGGRVAEEIFVEDVSSGARQDIEQATNLARSMVCEWGMSDKLGLVAYDERETSGQYLGITRYNEKKYSEETAQAIDNEVRRLLDEAHKTATKIITEKREQVLLMTDMLMEFETLDAEDIKKIYNGNWDIEEKRKKLKLEAELHRKSAPKPPPIPTEETSKKKPNDEPPPAPTMASDIRA